MIGIRDVETKIQTFSEEYEDLIETKFSLTIKNSDKLCSDIEASKEENDLHKVICRFLKESFNHTREDINFDLKLINEIFQMLKKTQLAQLNTQKI